MGAVNTIFLVFFVAVGDGYNSRLVAAEQSFCKVFFLFFPFGFSAEDFVGSRVTKEQFEFL